MLCAAPDALADFYIRSFGMVEAARGPAGITLTDGSFNLALLWIRPALREPHMAFGLHHLGIAVESIDYVAARYRALYPRGTVIREGNSFHSGEARIYDPECNPVTLSENEFGLGNSEPKIPRIAHIALNALDPEALLRFYRDVFGFRELFAAHAESRKRPGYRNKHVGDGFTNVAIQAFYNEEEGHEARFGIAHFGFLVEDSKTMADRVRREGASVAARPAHRTQSEIRMRDPEGNGCDLSQRGWEVDTDKWVRADAATVA
jgi:catechol 2,3-dioxygenase-like lactoylglutathione lyase family enzyme